MRTTYSSVFVFLVVVVCVLGDIHYTTTPLFNPFDSSTGPQLTGKTVVLSPHNGYSDGSPAGTIANGVLNDLMSNEIISLYVTQYLSNAGVQVHSVRERWFDQDGVVIVDNAKAVFEGAWTTDASSGYNSGFAYTSVSTTESAKATFKVTVAKNGKYPVYVRHPADTNRATSATYRISHTGGTTTVRLNQQVFNNIWQYVGIFHFSTDCSSCSVIVSNEGTETDKVVVADAVKVGSGKLSGVAAWKAGAGNFLPSIGFTYTSDSASRAEVGDYIKRNTASSSSSDYLYFLLRLNSALSAASGVETYSYNNLDTYQTADLATVSATRASKVQEETYEIINSIFTTTNRGLKVNANTELRESDLPSCVFYPGFLSNLNDVNFLNKASSREAVARGIYKGIAKGFISSPTYIPLPVTHLVAQNMGGKEVKLCWRPNTDSLEANSVPIGYKIYKSNNGYGFDDGQIVYGGTSYCYSFTNLIVGSIYYFKVAAFNAGGESLTRNMVGVRVIPENLTSASILFVDAFDRDFIYGTDDVQYRYQYNYIIQYAESIAASGFYFDSILNEYLSLESTVMNSYSTVIWSSGTDSQNDDSFSPTEQLLISSFVSLSGKSLFVSGSEIAHDLGNGTQSDLDFLNNVLKASYVAPTSSFSSRSSTPSTLPSISGVTFSTIKDDMYHLSSCDVISTFGDSKVEMVQTGTSNALALSYNGTYKLFYLSFPFETIDIPFHRDLIMSNSLAFFFNLAPVVIPTTAPSTSPTSAPTTAPSTSPTTAPSTSPTSAPSTSPTSAPSTSPTSAPSTSPTSAPSTSPTSAPSTAPTSAPSTTPTEALDSSTQTWIIIGAAGGGGLLLACMFFITALVFVTRRRNKKNKGFELGYSSGDVILGKVDRSIEVDSTLMNTNIEVALPGFLQIDYLVQIREEKPISAGGGGSLYEGAIVDPELSRRLGFSRIAIKKIHVKPNEKETDIEAFHREVSVMWSLAFDPHVIKLVGYSEKPRSIVTKLYKCDLFNYLHGKPVCPLPPELSLSFIRDICSGLNSIHNIEIAHRDVKSSNVLLDQSPDGKLFCVICDFGLAAVTEANIVTSDGKAKKSFQKGFSPRYAAPEVFIRSRIDHLAVNAREEMRSDIYSLGILIWEILSRQVPWDGLRTEEIETKVRTGERPPVPNATRDLNILYNLAQACWKEDVGERPHAAEVLRKLKEL